jgi:hypothetical protein
MGGFNWVNETSKCSPEMILGVLREVVDSDVKTVNGLNRKGVEFKLVDEATNKILVVRQRDMAGFTEGMAVVFELRSRNIHAYTRSQLNQKDPFHRQSACGCR